LILGGRQSKHRSDRLGALEAGRHVDRGAIGQRNHRADTGDRHQAPAHIIVPDDGQQPAMQDADLFAKHPPDKKQRFDQYRQVGKVLDKVFDPRLELCRAYHAHLEAEVAQRGAQVVLDGDRLRLQQLAMGHVWTAPAVQGKKSGISAKRSGAVMYSACCRLEDYLCCDAAAMAAGPDVIR
jgi:hypothetical protein